MREAPDRKQGSEKQCAVAKRFNDLVPDIASSNYRAVSGPRQMSHENNANTAHRTIRGKATAASLPPEKMQAIAAANINAQTNPFQHDMTIRKTRFSLLRESKLRTAVRITGTPTASSAGDPETSEVRSRT